MRTSSLNNNRYFILFIDDFSRMACVNVLKVKSKFFGIFKMYKTLVEKQSGKHIKVLRSDCSKKYNFHKFERFCEDEGLSDNLLFHILHNKMTSLRGRIAQSWRWLAKYFFGLKQFTLLCPTKAVQDKTLIEAWSGQKSSANHIRVFGSICYINVPNEKRHKLGDKIVYGIFLGYSTQSKDYRVYNLQTKKLTISRDIEVDKNAIWNCKEEKVVKNNIFIPMQQPQEEAKEVLGDLCLFFPSPQQQEFSLESTPRRLRSLMDIYETCNMAMLEPECYEEASKKEVWVKAMEEEIKMIEKNNTWEIIDCPHGKYIIGVKYIYKTKFNPDGTIQTHKARLVAKVYSLQPRVDYNETFAPVTLLNTIKALIAFIAQKGWSIYQLDIKSAFLCGVLEEKIYVDQPQALTAKAIKANFSSKLLEHVKRSKGKPILYIKTQGQCDTLIVSLYVRQQKKGIFISQKKYTKALLKKFKIMIATPLVTNKKLQKYVAVVESTNNKSVIAMMKNPIHHQRTKHVAIKYHFIREVEATKEIQLDYCLTKEQIANIVMKALARVKFEQFRTMLRVIKICIKEEC
ncbi:hypothetical protein CR513_38653, partial [Mucuna pruriens]